MKSMRAGLGQEVVSAVEPTVLCFQETTDTGFGDRLRGIAYLLHLAQRHGTSRLLYNDDETRRDPDRRARLFPGRMTDLIRIDGHSFEFHRLPFPKGGLVTEYDSVKDRKEHTRPAWRELRRLRPREDAVARRVAQIGVDHTWLGFHMRRTDNVGYGARYFDEGLVRRAIRNIERLARRYRLRQVFVAADNDRSLRRWRRIFSERGFEVRTSEPAYDPRRLRQTSMEAMLVDFFALAACRRVVRGVPSEFSRFAAMCGGRRLGYSDLV